jgi:hypothetical protein
MEIEELISNGNGSQAFFVHDASDRLLRHTNPLFA